MTALYAKVDPEGRVVQESAQVTAFDDTNARGMFAERGYVPVLAVRADAADQVRSELIGQGPSDYPELRSAALDNPAFDAGVKAGIRWVLGALGLPEQEEP